MTLAAVADVEARLGRELTDAEAARADGLLVEASVLVTAYCGAGLWDDTFVPEAVTVVTSRMVARVLSRPETLTGLESVQRGAGSFQETVRPTADSASGSPWLTKTDKLMLRPWATGNGGVSRSLVSERTK